MKEVRIVGVESRYVCMDRGWVVRLNSPKFIGEHTFNPEDDHLEWENVGWWECSSASSRATQNRHAPCVVGMAGRVDVPGLTLFVSGPSLHGAALYACASTPDAAHRTRSGSGSSPFVTPPCEACGFPRVLRRLS